MDGFLALNLIYFLDFYFTLMFLVGVYRRFELYQNILKLVRSGHRWPNLIKLVREHRAVFLTLSTVMPLILALSLSVVQWIASRVIWPNAGEPPEGLTVAKLLEHWGALPIVLPLGIGMFGVDIYFLIYVAKFDPGELEKHFDQAEYWLRSSTAVLARRGDVRQGRSAADGECRGPQGPEDGGRVAQYVAVVLEPADRPAVSVRPVAVVDVGVHAELLTAVTISIPGNAM